MLLRFAKWFVFSFIKSLTLLRYKIKTLGYEKLTKENLSKDGGILFLPNHVAEVDPIVVGSVLWRKYHPRPMIVEWIIQIPVVSLVMKLMKAVPIPNFEDKSSQKKRLEAENSFQTVVEGLKKKDNFLIYPAGRLKSTEFESLGGASGVYKIIQANKNINIVLVRTTGLWGSRFSRGWDGKRVIFSDAVIFSFLALLKNFIFFLPRRKVLVELEPINTSFPWDGSRIEVNRFLENWYNKKKDPLKLISYRFWKRNVDREFTYEDPVIDTSHVPENIKLEIIAEIARINKCLYTEVKPQMNLFSDLRMDSLDIQDLTTFLEEKYQVKNIKPFQLTTVASVMNYAAEPNEDLGKVNHTEKVVSSIHWQEFSQSPSIRAKIRGESIPEAFFKVACQRKKDLACVDMISGEMTYERLMLAVILLSKKIQKMPGEYIGIILPASITVNIVILACQVAKKTPVMINWTVGQKHLEAVIEQTKLERIISSDAFLRNMNELDLSSIKDKIVPAEKLRKEISFIDKLKAYFLIKLSYTQLVKILSIHNFDKHKVAVLIFTSGTETLPKGVPLTHENIISNLNSAFDRVETTNHDVILGFLPPFHSFGLTVTGLLPLLSGVRVVYYPNPLHYKKIGKLIGDWQITFLCGAPTFIKGILQPAHKEFFTSLRVIVSGAEKAPKSLIDRIEEVCPQVEFLEGYGLSECAPILSLNVPNQPHQGVGPALEVVDLLIVHPETNQPLARGQKGHVLASGPNIFSGYLGNFPSPFIEVKGKKWFKTGDLGYLDHRNYLTLDGRLKRQVKIGGEIVNLNAIEETLTHKYIEEKIIKAEEEDHPSLAVCAKDGDNKALIYLFVTFDIKLEDVNKKIRKLGFSNLYKIHEVIKIEKLPLMASGKIHYRDLEEKFIK